MEAAPTPGGAVRSAEVAAPGFRADLCSAFYPFAACSPVISGLQLTDYGLRWLRADAVLAHALPDRRAALMWGDPEQTAESVTSFDRRDGRRWLAAYRSWLALEDDLVAAMFTPFPPVRAATRLLARGGVGGTAHLGGNTARLSRTAASVAAGDDPTVPFVLVGQMSRADPTRSPSGTETAWAYTHLPYRYAGRGRDDAGIRGYVDRIEEMVDKLAPGFGELVVGRCVQGPKDLVNENANMSGALGGGTAALTQQLVLRPTPGLGLADTVIDRLYLASASAHPGPGVHGGPGANAARAAIHRDRAVAGAVYRATVSAAYQLIYRPIPPAAAAILCVVGQCCGCGTKGRILHVDCLILTAPDLGSSSEKPEVGMAWNSIRWSSLSPAHVRGGWRVCA
ncbi:phytoene desaturase family protein [Catellatospora paridis]|uniref:phytoene desaturase family protein n=1 Tax=Catellatospora paridis TaxID=1617086 RepID=UPI0012D49CC6|nr:hypothetical protein [Catellatospora paridis]